MKTILLFLAHILLGSVSQSSFAQQDNFIKEFLERLENSRKYLIAIAEAMPEDKYRFKPIAEERTFGEQLMHIAVGVDWHGQTLIGGRKERDSTDTTFKVENRSKQQIIDKVNKTFEETTLVLKQFNPAHLEDRLDYAGLSRTKRQIFLLLADHITHHRGQMIVYLRMNGIVPPEYVKYQ